MRNPAALAAILCVALSGAAAAQVPAPKLSGYVQVRETEQSGTGLSASLNRVRLTFDGSLPHRFSWRVMTEYEASAGVRNPAVPSLRDAYIQWGFGYGPLAGALRAGQFKTPFSREYVTSITTIETADRSTVVDSLATKRDIGLMGEASLGAFGSLSLGIFNGEGQNAILNRDSTVLVVARAVARPIPQLTLGGSLAAYESDSTRHGLEASFEQSGFLARAELVRQNQGRVHRNDHGWFALGAIRALAWLQLVGRYEDFQRPFLGAPARMRSVLGGANVDFQGGKTRLVLDGVRRRLGDPGTSRNTLIAQLQVRF